jgi:hypothetical protein
MNAPENQLSPEAQTHHDSMITVALAHYCAFIRKDSDQFRIARDIGIEIAGRHLPGRGETYFDSMTQKQGGKIKTYIKDSAMLLLAKTIERNGGHGTLPKPPTSDSASSASSAVKPL